MRKRRILRIQNEKSAGTLANPLHQPVIAGAFEESFHAVKRIADAAAGGVRLAPFVNHRSGKAEVGGDFLGLAFLKNFAEQFVGLHGGKMEKRGGIGKRNERFQIWAKIVNALEVELRLNDFVDKNQSELSRRFPLALWRCEVFNFHEINQ